ncbi:hypothetical protein [Paenibacillus sp. PDC88]|uniref:hypothetical protein n=1 Tax=Paenibacillus sp. PDC88 TaxID=1884375 RepID=UPI00096D934B|nr:hypothetical protein [Paenibacillus sp. PDC88]OMC68398.1 hypothetical protein BK126_11195 [Paenibacillus sp. FSL H7-0326]
MLNAQHIKRIFHAVLLFAVLMLLTACANGLDSFNDPKSLMKTPQLTSERENLLSVIQGELPEGSTITQPREMSNKIIQKDLNNDGIMEAVVFYDTPDEEVKIHGMVLEKRGVTWVKKLTFDGLGSVLNSFRLQDITGDDDLEIIAGFSNSVEQNAQNWLASYSYNGSTLQKILEMPYSKYVIVDESRNPMDMNGDGINDLTIMNILPTSGQGTVTVYQYKDEVFEPIDKLTIETRMRDFYNVSAGKISPNHTGILLDIGLDASNSYTDVVYMENNQLVEAYKGIDITFKPRKIISEDINNDGIVEFGLLEIPPGWEMFVDSEKLYFYSFYQWNGKDDMTFVMQQYRDDQDRFYFNLKPEQHGNVTLDTKSVKDKYLRFKLVDTDETVAEIKFFSLDEWEKVKVEWKQIVRSSNQVIGYRLPKQAGVTESDNIPQEMEQEGMSE